MTRSATSASNLRRLGFLDPEVTLEALGHLGDAAEPLLALLGRTADPDAAIDGLVRLADAVEDPQTLLHALVEDEGTAMRVLCVLGASEALSDHLARHPDQWRELHRLRPGPHPPGRVGDARIAAGRGRRRAPRSGADRDRARRGCGRCAPGGVPTPAAAARRPRPDPPPGARRCGRRDLRPSGRHPRSRPRHRPATRR